MNFPENTFIFNVFVYVQYFVKLFLFKINLLKIFNLDWFWLLYPNMN